MLTNLLRRPAVVCLWACIAIAALCTPAHADVTDLGSLQNGVPAEYPGGNGQVAASFLVEEDAMVRVVFSGGTVLFAYKDAAHTDIVEGTFAYVNGKATYTYNEFAKGETIYFYNNFVMNGGTITVTNGDIPVAVESTIPDTNPQSPGYYGGKYSISGDARVIVVFNIPVKISSAQLTTGSTTLNLSPNVSMTSCELQVAPQLMQMYKNGTLKEGDEVTVTLSNIVDSSNPENVMAEYVLKFVMNAQPIEIVSTQGTPASGTPEMLSYYLAGNPQALVKLTFSGPVSDTDKLKPFARISYGDRDVIEGGMYIEELPATVEGNTITIDLAGVDRRPSVMTPDLPVEKRPDIIDLSILNVHSADGQWVYTGSTSNPYSFGYNYKLNVLQYNIASDFTPKASKGLTQGEEMEIYVMEGKEITFSGVKFAYTASGAPTEVIVPMDKVTVAPDDFNPEEDILITLTVPELPGIDSGSAVTVTLNDLICADGIDHTSDIECTYSSFTASLTSIGVDAIPCDVYNAQGLRVLSGSSDLSTLPAGLYIMQGRKVIIK